MQATGYLHHDVRDTLGGQPQDIFDNPTPFDASNDVFDNHARAGKDAIEKLLADTQFPALIVLEGRIITMDALLTQRQVAQTIMANEGDYVMIVKEDQPQLRADIEQVFVQPP